MVWNRTFLLGLSSVLFACSGPHAGGGECTGDSDNEYCKPVMEAAPDDGKADSVEGLKGLPSSVDGSDTVVWEVWNQWHETDTAEARAAGMAWGQDSGLDWDEKYSRWIESMEKIDGFGTYYKTFELTTPWGKKYPAPNLECAEVALFLRATFAAWYHLPFYVAAWDPSAGRVYFGHFGARTKTGRYGNLPRFRNSYDDHTDTWDQVNWPSDPNLRTRKLSKSGDDENDFLGDDLYSGAYFDEIFLNKRAGYFMYYLLIFTGSMHLASSNNTFNLKPEVMREGDVLLERWQKKGIGHTLVVKRVEPLPGDRLDAELASGSMPRRQPKWESGPSSKSTFTNTYCGGEGENHDGDAYAALGGGLKRWRAPRIVNGYYRNRVPDKDLAYWIPSTDREAIAGRIETLQGLLGELTPVEKRDMLVEKIEDKRAHLRDHPSSCSARIGREEAFNDLYEVMQTSFGKDREQVDRLYRKLDDYVLAELVYEQSRTCCWNSTTRAMYEIIMDYNLAQAWDTETGVCRSVEVFKVSGGGYDVFETHAQLIGRGHEWVAWSADESCPQSDVENDTEAEHTWTAQCDIIDVLVDGAGLPVDECTDVFEGNDDRDHAAPVPLGAYPGLRICSGEEDWFAVTLDGNDRTVLIAFETALGDLDLELYGGDGNQIGFSNGTGDSESVDLDGQPAGTVFIRVFGYNNATNEYTLKIE
ncbi:MAG: PPC domain-containing protein [Deltaproteobacteria bacterium]|nr:PPC domain-containing protein [Deltaproteobacteria bacterium]